MAATVWDLSLPALLFALGVVVAGGVVRGFGGFGGAMVWVAGLVVLLPPTSVIPTVFVLEVVASAAMLPQVWRQVHWKSLRWLFAGTLIGMPLGMWALTQLSGDLVRVLLGVAIIGSAVAMAAVPDRQSLPGPGVTTVTGVASGLLNGGFALGGPPAVLMYFSASTHVAAGRASLVVFFLVIDAFGAAGRPPVVSSPFPSSRRSSCSRRSACSAPPRGNGCSTAPPPSRSVNGCCGYSASSAPPSSCRWRCADRVSRELESPESRWNRLKLDTDRCRPSRVRGSQPVSCCQRSSR